MSDSPATLTQLFFGAVERFSTKQAAVRYKAGDRWRDITHQEFARRVHHVALGLRELGIQAGDRVAILSPNRPEWAITDFACLTIGVTDVPIYASLLPAQIEYILRDAGAKVVFTSGQQQYDKIAEIRDNLPDLEHVVAFDPLEHNGRAMMWSSLLKIGAAAEGNHPTYRDDALAIAPDTVATIIYTSGTTGEPKGVMLTHGNLASNVRACVKLLPIGPTDVCLSLLPLSHGFERTAGQFVMWWAGVTIHYAESIDAMARNLLEVRPTVMLSVPRLYEKMYARVMEAGLSGGAAKRRLFLWAKRVGELWADSMLSTGSASVWIRVRYRVARRLVFSKFAKRTGGRLRYFVSGGAPLLPEIARFFYAAGLPILEGYGLTETSPVITVNPLAAPRPGTVGRAVEGVEVKIAPDGEILSRGPHIMPGYFNKPEATAEAIDAEGWFHTGDIGEIDDDGYLRITDRKKDLIVTAGGKKIAPQPIESRVKANSYVLNAVMLGDKRKFPIILIVPDLDALAAWAETRRLAFTERRELLQIPDAIAMVEREVMVNLRDLASYQRPKKILIVEDDFTIERNELTPTLKVKRRVVEQHYRERIDAAYEEAAGEPG